MPKIRKSFICACIFLLQNRESRRGSISSLFRSNENLSFHSAPFIDVVPSSSVTIIILPNRLRHESHHPSRQLLLRIGPHAPIPGHVCAPGYSPLPPKS